MKPTVYPPTKSKLITGVNDLLTKFPKIASELINDDPATILATTVKNYDWECSLCGNNWSTAPKSRVISAMASVGCPDCSRKQALKDRGVKKTLAVVLPAFAKQLKDSSLAKTLTYSSHTVVTWICDNGHEFDLSVNKRVNGLGCQFCAFRSVLIGFNNLGAVRPDLVKELVNQEDANLMGNSTNKITWFHIADDGVSHEWLASPRDRAYSNYGCLVCDGKVVQIGVNDFKSRFLDSSDLVWGENDFEPDTISYGSRKTIQVVCKKHKPFNVMSAFAKDILRGHVSCQDCVPTHEKFRSKGENEIFEYLKKMLPDALVEQSVRRFKSSGVHEIDIFVDNKFAVDFNGTYWHKEGIIGVDGFKPHGYHAKKRDDIEALGFVFIEVEEADWKKDPTTIKQQLLKQFEEYSLIG